MTYDAQIKFSLSDIDRELVSDSMHSTDTDKSHVYLENISWQKKKKSEEVTYALEVSVNRDKMLWLFCVCIGFLNVFMSGSLVQMHPHILSLYLSSPIPLCWSLFYIIIFYFGFLLSLGGLLVL